MPKPATIATANGYVAFTTIEMKKPGTLHLTRLILEQSAKRRFGEAPAVNASASAPDGNDALDRQDGRCTFAYCTGIGSRDVRGVQLLRPDPGRFSRAPSAGHRSSRRVAVQFSVPVFRDRAPALSISQFSAWN